MTFYEGLGYVTGTLQTGFALKLGSQDSRVPSLPLERPSYQNSELLGGYVAQHTLGHQGISMESFQREDRL